ncbi:TetR/AcrR family transcriptional regulator [Frankia sp. AgPm24]|uniref:TetR/AcrR family transcriptional regulator n=1 Tax=Frankia umida TaxID=573489 RepID=A0ABT0JXZ3_9ACTN|nr:MULTISPECIES: TetR/AcrR family transcriptional regulator C-terminal domain-containing protein [Frankia]MCK9876404.1 TetR/AcrR family transcriptional regulator [Frankia umida]MCK9920371.1 TetR/AcrR family transcriptional regulator [Frankia sp. AgPm24]
MGDQNPAATTPDRESAVPPWARPRVAGRPPLTREEIVDAAVSLADAEGLPAVSIRRVAAVLSARPMSLYSHFDRKDDLLALMHDRVTAEVLVPEPLPADWRAALRAIAHHTRQTCLRHPWLLQTQAGATRLGPNALRHAEQSAAAVAGLPLTPARRIALLCAVDTYTFGQVGIELRERLTERDQDQLTAYLDSMINSGEYPHLARLPRQELLALGYQAEQSFDEGLGWLLAGVAASLGVARS